MTAHIAQPLPRGGRVPLPGRLGGNVAAAASMVVWAAGFPAADALLATWAPLALVPARFAMAALLLVPLLVILEGWPQTLPWRRGLWLGGVGLGGAALLLILAQAVTDPVTVAVIASVSPLAATLVEWATERRPLTPSFLWGLLASVAGGVIATMGGEAGGGNLALGAVLAAGSCLVYSWATYETVRSLPGQTALARSTATILGGLLAGVLMLAGWSLWGGAVVPEGGLGWSDFWLLLVYGMGGMALSQLLFVLAVQKIGVALSSFHINIAPFYVMLILLALGGDWSWLQAAGAAIVLLGVLLAQR